MKIPFKYRKLFSDFLGLLNAKLLEVYWKGATGSLWYEMYWFKKQSYQNLRHILLIQSENEKPNIQGMLNLWRMRNLT